MPPAELPHDRDGHQVSLPHVDIELRFRTLHGFCLNGVYYDYALLPFGLCVAACTFCVFSPTPEGYAN